MLSEIDSRVLLAVAVVVGLFTGYVVNNSIVSGPKINSLNEENSELQIQINELVSDKQVLEDELTNLQNDYGDLEKSLNEEIGELESEITELEEELESQQESSAFDEIYIDELNSIVGELMYNLSILELKYADLYNPLEIEFEIDDLSFKISIETDVYPDSIPLEGSVEITELDGTDFVGTFKLEVTKIYFGTRFASNSYEIDGSLDYVWPGAFLLGPGSYKFNLSEVRDVDGNSVALYSELRKHSLYLIFG